jgi:hypothetical protein
VGVYKPEELLIESINVLRSKCQALLDLMA